MARKRKQLPMSKSEAIRTYKEQNPNIGPKRMAEVLNKQGYDLTAQFISTVLSNDRRKKGLTKRNKSVDELSITDLQLMKEFVEKQGGIENSQIVLNAYSKLISH